MSGTLKIKTPDGIKTIGLGVVESGAETLDDLTDVDLTGATDGDVLALDGATWKPAAPTGGGSSLLSVDDPTLWAGSVFDQEFDGSGTSLPSGWAWDNQGSSTYLERFGAGSLNLSAAGGFPRLVYKTAPSGDWTMTAHVTGIAKVGSAAAHFVGLRESGTGRLITFDVHLYSGGLMGAYQWTTSTSYNNTFGSSSGLQLTDVNYHRLTKSGSNITWAVSPDGVAWVDFIVSTDMSGWFTPDQIGFGGRCDSGPIGVACHWLRFE